MATVNEELLDRAIRHQHFFERLKGKEGVEAVAWLNDELFPELTAKLQSKLPRIRSRGYRSKVYRTRQLQDLHRSLDDIITTGYQDLYGLQSKNLVGTGITEAEWQALTLKQTTSPFLGIDFKVPGVNLIRAVVKSSPFEGSTLKGWFKKEESALKLRVRQEIAKGIAQGETTPQIVRRLVGRRVNGYRDGIYQISRRNANTLVRTATNHVAAQARELTYQENSSVIQKVQWVSTLDGKTSDICIGLDGQTFPLGEGIRPPAHMNAIVGGTLIETARGPIPIENVHVGELVLTHESRWRPVTAVMSKFYERPEVIEVKLNSGGVLRMTDDHPVLAVGRGWIRACELEAGDQLFENREQPSGVEWSSRISEEANDHPAPLAESFIPGQIRVDPGSMASTIDLHGNLSCQAKVDYEIFDDVLVLEPDVFSLEDLDEGLFGEGDSLSKGRSEGVADLDSGLVVPGWVSRLHALRGCVSTLGSSDGVELCPVVVPGRADAIGIGGPDACGSVSDYDSMQLAEMRDLPSRETEFSADVPAGSPLPPVFFADDSLKSRLVHWSPVEVLSVAIVAHELPVFNLAVEEDETFIAGGVIVHNCRSTTVPVLKSWKQLGINLKEAPAGTRASMNGQVPAKLNYLQWLKSQSVSTQNEALGVGRAKMFRSGKLTIDKFRARSGKGLLTLAQLRAKEGLPPL